MLNGKEISPRTLDEEKPKRPSPPLKKSSVINPRGSLDEVVHKKDTSSPPQTNPLIKRLSLREDGRPSSGSPHRPGTPSQKSSEEYPPHAPRKMLGNLRISKALQRNKTELPSQFSRSKASSPAANSPHTPSPHSQSSTSSLLTSASYSKPFESDKGEEDEQSRQFS
ncbi:hypothetical protein IPF37_02045 [bacterium]|nr:MAG: hypothetical protein IPF37_02045 [bacterium]